MVLFYTYIRQLEVFKDFNTWSFPTVILFTCVVCIIFILVCLLIWHYWGSKGIIYFWGLIVTILGLGILYTANTMN